MELLYFPHRKHGIYVKRWDAPQGERQYPWDTDLQEQWGITDFTEDPTPTAQGFDHGHI